MTVNAYDLSAGVFVRGLSNLKAQLARAEAHAAVGGTNESTLLHAQLARDEQPADAAREAQHDLHRYTLAAHVHWAAEGPRVAIARVLGARPSPTASDAKSISELQRRIDATIAYLRGITATDLEAGVGRPIVIENRGGSVSSNGGRYLLAFAIPHFFYHVSAAYGILRNAGVPLTMGDFLGDWNAASQASPQGGPSH